MHPVTMVANVVVVAEAVVGLLVTALATGLVFAKFSVSNARIVFSNKVVITPMNGQPTLMFRLGNERANEIVEATLRATLMRTETTKEGVKYYRMYDLKLVRERTQAFSRSWTVLHVVDDESPFFGATPESLKNCEAELLCGVVGTDDTSLQPVHARHTYSDDEIVFGARHADILEDKDGTITLDLTRFHHVVATEPTETFPFPTR
jgi:inward rectifier potassium channel